MNVNSQAPWTDLVVDDVGPEIRQKLDIVESILSDLGSVVVAYSGGVDSSVLAAIAVRTLGSRARLVTAVSPSLAAEELKWARVGAAAIGAPLHVVHTDEAEREDYAANSPNRCYVCKGIVFARLRQVADAEGAIALVYGANADDGGDYRPGAGAAIEAGVRAPLAEAGLTKREVRQVAKAFGLPCWDKPAAPCLASRIPYGQRVTIEKLRQIEAGERVLHRLGFGESRLRHHGDVARLEVQPDDLSRAVESGVRDELLTELTALGFHYVALDLRGFRSGSLNEALRLRPEMPASASSTGTDSQTAAAPSVGRSGR
jgi:uncharacterized protein